MLYFFSLVSMFLVSLLLLMVGKEFLLCLNFLDLGLNYFMPFYLGVFFNSFSLSFLMMLSVVSFLVFSYSEFYMDPYNNKKFSALILLFIGSMVLLCLNSSILVLMVGWDYLGLTSICLIMFYPNKFTMFNSVLTMFFNRVGDILMILVICFMALSNNLICQFSANQNIFFWILLLLCAMTKSAQFPMSSWLPAAMSAPTPISALVHSSTLVTAGIFIVASFWWPMYTHHVTFMLSIIAISTFLMGGLMGVLESDLKKVIAFSTMSQISMILLFCSIFTLSLALAHMFFHATFKSLLFCCAGTLFIFHFMNQRSENLATSQQMSVYIVSMLVISCFSMTGLMFSSSFFTKDLVLEFFVDKSSFIFFLVLSGSLLTIVYTSKILLASKYHLMNYNSTLSKMFSSNSIMYYSVGTLMLGMLFSPLIVSKCLPVSDSLDVVFTSGLIILVMMLGIKIKNYSMGEITTSIMLMKWVTFSLFSLANSKVTLPSVTFSDHTFFKPELIKFGGIALSSRVSVTYTLLFITSILALLA